MYLIPAWFPAKFFIFIVPRWAPTAWRISCCNWHWPQIKHWAQAALPIMTWLFLLPARLFLVYKDGTHWGSGRLQEGTDQQWRLCGIHTRWKGMYVAFFPPSPCKLSSREYYPFLIQNFWRVVSILIVGSHSECLRKWRQLQTYEKFWMIENALCFFSWILLLVPSTCIISAVSIVHECSSDCKFIPSTTTSKVLERENIQLSGSVFTHVYSNHLAILLRCV